MLQYPGLDAERYRSAVILLSGLNQGLGASVEVVDTLVGEDNAGAATAAGGVRYGRQSGTIGCAGPTEPLLCVTGVSAENHVGRDQHYKAAADQPQL